MEEQRQRIRRLARTALVACGLCFGLLFLMALSGASTFMLQLHGGSTPLANLSGIEGVTMKALTELKPVIAVVHGWGGYVSILLAGWAGIAFFAFARELKRTESPDWRSAARWLGPVAGLGAAVVILAVVLLLASGVAAKGYFQHIDGGIRGDVTSVERGVLPLSADEALAGYGDSQLAEWHIREMNYLLAIGALMLVFAAARARKISLQARKE
jgi:hypothetical protein